MDKIALDERLAAIAELVREGKIVADIGTDHGYLVTHLVLSRKCPRGYACDINPLPLSKARQRILYHGLGSRIGVMCIDGLTGIDEAWVDDIVIAGMGGDLIARIVTEWEGFSAEGKRFILQPMTKAEHLRAALYLKGFLIEDEIVVSCGQFLYVIIVAVYTGSCVEISGFFAWTGRLWEKPGDPLLFAYFVAMYKELCIKAEGLAKSGRHPVLAAEYAEIAKRVYERIKEWTGQNFLPAKQS